MSENTVRYGMTVEVDLIRKGENLIMLYMSPSVLVPSVLHARLEEDLDSSGLALETRLYDESGKQTVKVKVRKHHEVKGVAVVDEMESEAETPAGTVASETACSQISLETEP